MKSSKPGLIARFLFWYFCGTLVFSKRPMDIFLTDPTEVPLPPDEVRILHLQATPLDERRVRVYLEVDPFQRRPNIDLTVLDEQGQALANVTIIEIMQRKMELIMHLADVKPDMVCTLQADLFFATLPMPGEGPDAPTDFGNIERQDVDQAIITFNLSP